jgi:hypothetical protein
MKYSTHIIIVLLMILNVYLFTFCKCKQIKEKFSLQDVIKDNSLIKHIQKQNFHKNLLDTTMVEQFSISTDQILRMEQNAVQLLKDLQQLKYVSKGESEVTNENNVVEEEFDDNNSESSEIEDYDEQEHDNEIEGFVEMCTSNCSTI